MGNKALAYRKDLLSPEESEQLENAMLTLTKSLKKTIISSNLEDVAQKVDEALRNWWFVLPKETWVENGNALGSGDRVIGIAVSSQPFIIPN